jgi:hypothetical protein
MLAVRQMARISVSFAAAWVTPSQAEYPNRGYDTGPGPRPAEAAADRDGELRGGQVDRMPPGQCLHARAMQRPACGPIDDPGTQLVQGLIVSPPACTEVQFGTGRRFHLLA